MTGTENLTPSHESARLTQEGLPSIPDTVLPEDFLLLIARDVAFSIHGVFLVKKDFVSGPSAPEDFPSATVPNCQQAVFLYHASDHSFGGADVSLPGVSTAWLNSTYLGFPDTEGTQP